MKYELDVIRFSDKGFTNRKFGFIDPDKALGIFDATVRKFKEDPDKILITLRAETEDNYFTLINSYLHDPKGSVQPKVSV